MLMLRYWLRTNPLDTNDNRARVNSLDASPDCAYL
jgi:hypothetical protein